MRTSLKRCPLRCAPSRCVPVWRWPQGVRQRPIARTSSRRPSLVCSWPCPAMTRLAPAFEPLLSGSRTSASQPCGGGAARISSSSDSMAIASPLPTEFLLSSCAWILNESWLRLRRPIVRWRCCWSITGPLRSATCWALRGRPSTPGLPGCAARSGLLAMVQGAQWETSDDLSANTWTPHHSLAAPA